MMEGKGTDVAFFILLCLLKALLEVAVFLEAVLLSHLALLFLCLHDAAFRAEVLQLSVEHLVFAEFAFQRTVVKRNFDARLQANLVETFLAIAEHPGIVAFELVLQSLANHLIGAQQVGCRDALAIGRIGDDDALLAWLCEILEILLHDGDIIRQTCSLHIQCRRIHSLHVDVVAVDMVLEFPFLTLVIVDVVKEICVEVRPFLEGIFFAEESWGHVLCNEGSLDEQGA